MPGDVDVGDRVELLPDKESIAIALIGKICKVLSIDSDSSIAEVQVIDEAEFSPLKKFTTWWRSSCMKRRNQVVLFPPEVIFNILSFSIQVPTTNEDFWNVIQHAYRPYKYEIESYKFLADGHAHDTATDPKFHRLYFGKFQQLKRLKKWGFVERPVNVTFETYRLTDKMFQFKPRPIPTKKEARYVYS